MIPEKVRKVFEDNPEILIVVDGENRYYRGIKGVCREVHL